MTLYIVGYRDAAGRWVLAERATYVDALLHRAALRRMGIHADIMLREVDRVPAGHIETVEVG